MSRGLQKTLFSFAAILLFLGFLEILLVLGGIADPSRALDLKAGFLQNKDYLITDSSQDEFWTINSGKYPGLLSQRFLKHKPENVYRIVITGGSNVYFFQNELQTLAGILSKYRTDLKFEILNFGGLSYGTQRLLNLIPSIETTQPDLVIIYSGHNEFEESRLYEKQVVNTPRYIRFIQNGLHHWRGYLLLRKGVRSLKAATVGYYSSEDVESEMNGRLNLPDKVSVRYTAFTDSNHRDWVLDRYESNLRLMISLLQKEKIQVALGTVASNYFCRPFSPCSCEDNHVLTQKRAVEALVKKEIPFVYGINLKAGEFFRLYTLQTNKSSPPRYGLYSSATYKAFLRFFQPFFNDDRNDFGYPESELDVWQQAEKMLDETGENCDAEFAFLAGLVKFKLGKYSEAEILLNKAMILDCSPRRGTRLSNEKVRSVAGECHVPMLDGALLVASHAFNNLPGWDLFDDHCHLNDQGKRLILSGFAQVIIENELVGVR